AGAPTVASGDTVPLDDARPAGDESELLTRPGSMMGTPGYMPPEQAAGRWDAVDRQCDVFGLGAVLCALLTGQPPYTGTRPVLSRTGYWASGEALAQLDGCGASP